MSRNNKSQNKAQATKVNYPEKQDNSEVKKSCNNCGNLDEYGMCKANQDCLHQRCWIKIK